MVLSAVGLPPWLVFDGSTLSGIPPKKGDVELEIEGKTATGLSRKVPLLIRVDTKPSDAKPSVEVEPKPSPPKAKAPPSLSVVNQQLGREYGNRCLQVSQGHEAGGEILRAQAPEDT